MVRKRHTGGIQHGRLWAEPDIFRRGTWRWNAIFPLLLLASGATAMVTLAHAMSRFAGAGNNVDALFRDADPAAIFCTRENVERTHEPSRAAR